MSREMNQTERFELLSAYADGASPPEREAEILALLESDEEAFLFVEDQRILSSALRASLEEMGEEADFRGFADGVMARIEATRAAPAAEASGWTGRIRAAAAELFPRRRAPAFVGAAALATLAVALSPLFGSGDERIPLAGDPGDALVLSMTTMEDSGATIFKTEGGTTIIYLTSRE